jgi:hypothetical protein
MERTLERVMLENSLDMIVILGRAQGSTQIFQVGGADVSVPDLVEFQQQSQEVLYKAYGDFLEKWRKEHGGVTPTKLNPENN